MKQNDHLHCQFQNMLNSNSQLITSIMDRSPSAVACPTTKSLLLPPPNQHDPKQFEVICRVRPLQGTETPSDVTISPDSKTIVIQSQPRNCSKQFTFHKIYEESTTQASFTRQISEQIFNNCRIIGKGSLVLSYGVTNSGKTYSILGTQEEPGLLPVLVQRIENEFPDQLINITAIQAYNDEFYSLKNKQRLFPKQSWGTYQFDDYQPEKITKISTKFMMKQYMINRYQTDTHSNKKSSRSHAIFKIQCDQLSVAIVDLAGSQRITKANSKIQETTSINSSLLVLGKCIHAFRDNAIIPFRESKLTKALTEYFTPRFKIYMIAHINRSGQMFHQNLKVLEYAAVSTMVKPLNPQVNRSILKSVCKKSLAKSAMKNKICAVVDSDDEKLQVKSCLPMKKKKLKKDIVQISPEVKELQQVIERQDKKRRRTFMQKYINQMIGRMNEFDYYLDRQFEKEDQSDRKFISQLQTCHYESPSKKVHVGYEIKKAQARIQLRKQILTQLQYQKKGLVRDAQTFMGPSMRKCLEESIKKDMQRQLQNHACLEQKQQKNDQIEKLQIQPPQEPSQQNQFSNNQKFERQGEQPQLEEDSLTTPKKIQIPKQQGQSFFKRAMNNPNLILESGFKAIKSAGEAFNSMIESFRKIVHQNKGNGCKDMRRVVKIIQKLSICKQESFNFNFKHQLQSLNKQSYVHKEQQQQLRQEPFKQFNERGVGSGYIKESALVVSQANSISQMLKQSDCKSETEDQDSRPQSLVYSTIIQSIPQRRQSEQFYQNNSPFSHIHDGEAKNQSNQIAQKVDKKQNSQLNNFQLRYNETSKDQQEITFKDCESKHIQQHSQTSIFTSRVNSDNNDHLQPQKSTKNLKRKYNRKPLTQTTQMQFVISSTHKNISPLKTRSGKTTSQAYQALRFK